MSWQTLKEQAIQLSISDRLALLRAIIESLQAAPDLMGDRAVAISRMRGFLKTDQPAPTDEDVAVMLEERRLEKYL